VSYDVHGLRAREFPWAARGDAIYLNNASTGPLPARTVAAVAEFTHRRAEPFRLRDGELSATMRRVRELAAGLVGAGADEIACMPNTSYGLNLAARALPLGPGDVVLTSTASSRRTCTRGWRSPRAASPSSACRARPTASPTSRRCCAPSSAPRCARSP
jgi:kynureninase